LKSLFAEENQAKVQPMRALKASSFCNGARETATSVVSRAARCGIMRSKPSAQNEQLLQPSLQSGANMKCCTTSWLRPANRSASVCLPFGPSNI
jgi:hypothetical protein